jgi:hypothetical protein
MAMVTFDFRPHAMLLAAARQQQDDAQYPIAVVTAQMAFEVRVEQSLTALYAETGTEAVRPDVTLVDRSFMADQSRSAWRELTGDRISRAPSWRAYHRHIERRNKLAHGSLTWIDGEECASSVQAVRDLIAHVEAVEATAVARLQPKSS